jgi:hypothetical protein
MVVGSWFRFKRDKVRHELVSLIRPHPRIFLPYAIVTRGSRAHRIRRNSQIVIEGFERSGNTFAVLAFSASQPQPVEIAHHLHAAAQVVQAVRWRIPALVLFRRPEDAILSFLLFHPALSASQAMSTYIRFYAPLLPYRDRLVLARFDTVTTDFGSVIRCVNGKFGTDFVEFDHSDEKVRKLVASMDDEERTKSGRIWVEEVTPRPSAWREERKEAIRPRFHDAALAGLRRRVDEIYAACEAVANV